MESNWFEELSEPISLFTSYKSRFILLMQEAYHVTWDGKILGKSSNIKPYRHGFPRYVGSFPFQWQCAPFFVISKEETWNYQETL